MLQVSRIIIASALLMLLSGCASVVAIKNAPTARPALVTVMDKINLKLYPDWGMAVNKAPHKPFLVRDNETVHNLYRVRDTKGRISFVVSDKNFPPYECATLWRDIDNPYYPRLTVATEDCKPLEIEPDDDVRYIYHLNSNPGNLALSRSGLKGTFEPYYRYLDNWLDLPEEKVISLLGEPDEREEKGDEHFLTYHKAIGGSPYTDPPTAQLVSPPFYTLNKCTTTLEIRDGIVFFYTSKGMRCYSPGTIIKWW